MSLHGHNGKRFSNFRGVGEDSDDDDAEVLPSATANNYGDNAGQNSSEGVWRDGQWFSALDEQYLLPVFSNATASRRQATRKAMRSSARLTQHGNESYIDDNETERDLTALSREGSRSPWDASSGADGRQGQGSAGGSATGVGRDGTAGQGRNNSRGFVNDSFSYHPTPSLSAAVSSLFSSMSPVSSSMARHDTRDGETSSGGGAILPLSTARQYPNNDTNDHVQELIVPDGSLAYTTSTPPMPSVSLASFRMPKRRTSDEQESQSIHSTEVSIEEKGVSTSTSPLREGHSPNNKSDFSRSVAPSMTASIFREEALQRRLSTPAPRIELADSSQSAERTPNNRSRSSAGHL